MSGEDPAGGNGKESQKDGVNKNISSSKGINIAANREKHEAMQLVDPFHPLYLHPSDNPSNSMITKKLTSPQTYVKWCKALMFLLRGRNKLGFINGTCVKENYDPIYHDLWDRCDTVVLGWIFNSVSDEIGDTIMYMEHAADAFKDLKQRFDKVDGSRKYQLHREIILCTQGLDTISAFFTRLRHLWAEYDAVCALPYIDHPDFVKHIEHKEEQELFQFLNGLNENYANAKSNLLQRDPLPPVNIAYNVLVQEENQRKIAANIAEASANVSAVSEKGRVNQNLECSFCHKKGHLADRCFAKGCEFCKRKGHVKEMCFKYKESQKAKGNMSKASVSAGNGGPVNPAATEPSTNSDASGGIYFTKEQFDHFMKTMTQSGGASTSAGAATVKDTPSCSNGPLKWEGLGDWK